MAITPPATLARPFAESGDKAIIPDTTSTAGVASLTEGFPPVTQLPLSAGGIPPRRLDFNGILNLLSRFAFWAQSGGQFRWNSALDYASPCMVFGSDGKIYFGVAPSGPGVSGVGAKNPVTAANQGTYWVSLTGYALEPATTTRLGGIKVGDGFTITADGKLSVNPNSFSSDLITELMKQLRLPQWLSKNTTFYVSPSGKDSNDGLTRATAFLTIQKAVDYVAENFNIGVYTATIMVLPGVYRSSRIYLPKYQSVTGSIIIEGEDKDAVILETTINNTQSGSGFWSVTNLTIRYFGEPTSGGTSFYALNVSSGNSMTLENVTVLLPQIDSAHLCYFINAGPGGSASINAGCSVEGYFRGALLANGGSCRIQFDFAVNGTVAGGNNYAVARAINGGKIECSPINSGYPQPLVTGTVTGKRYLGTMNSLIVTGGGGPEFFPGTIAGSTTTGAQYS